MINLLPPKLKENYIYARRNTSLLRWSFAFLLGMAGMVGMVGFGQIYINRSTDIYSKQAAAARAQLEAADQTATQARVNDITNSLKLAVQVLSKQVLFSKLIQQIGSVTPQGAALTDLRIAQLQGGIDLQFVAADYETGTQIQVNLQDPNNKIFDKADLVNINCADTATTDPRYPCTVTIRASFAKNNPFLFISPTTGATP